MLFLASCSSSDGPANGGNPDPNQPPPDGGVAENDSGQPKPPRRTAPAPARTPPADGALLGAFVGVGQNSEADFLAEEEILGREWVIDHRFYSTEDWTERTKWAIAHFKIPMITWEPHEKLDDIIAGNYDDMIKSRAQGLKALGAEIYLRWGHEMNGNWYPWSGALNGQKDGPAKYIAAYRHVYDVFKAEAATNVVWIWCPLVTDVPNDPWNHWTNYYPGDDYVDWIGMDAYNWGASSSCCVWQTFTELIADFYKDYATKKPMMLPETSSAEIGGNKAAWIKDMHQKLKTDFKEIKALVWFDINKETDWRIASSPATLAAYKEMADDPYFNP